ncbi:MAG: helix-turn-helix domain-containing protein [Pyrinomonadaceae bacterium]
MSVTNFTDRTGTDLIELLREIVRQELRRERLTTQQHIPDDEMLTLRDAARLVNQSPRTLRDWASKNKVRCHKSPGGHLRFHKQELLDDAFGGE